MADALAELERWLRFSGEHLCSEALRQSFARRADAVAAAISELEMLRKGAEWRPIDTPHTLRPGEYYIFWEPEVQSGRSRLAARINSDRGYTRKPTHWRIVIPPIPTENET